MRGTYITAIVIALVILAWLLSGQFGDSGPDNHPSLAEANRERAAEDQDAAPVRVRARVVQARPQVQEVVLRGRTQNKRTVEVKSETSGQVVERPVDRGTRVDAGDLLCRISLEDREASLIEAQAALEQARIEHQGSLRLQEKGFQSETAIAQAKARLAAAEAQVARSELDIERTQVRAPFRGMVEDVHLEVGDYATSGAMCVTLVDLDPMQLVGRVSERQVTQIRVGETATGILSNGQEVRGPIVFVGQQADPGTRTYPVAIDVPNADYQVRSGITTEIRIPTDRVMAHKISPALFTLDDDGHVGVRTVDERQRVEYHRVDIVRDDTDGVWVTGLPEIATLITVGQEMVVTGQAVEVSFEASSEMPAKAGSGTEPPSSSHNGARAGSVVAAAKS